MKRKTRLRIKPKASDFFSKNNWSYSLTDKQRAGAIRRALGGGLGGVVVPLLREVCERVLDSVSDSVTRDAFIDGVKFAFRELWIGRLYAMLSDVSDKDIVVEVVCDGENDFPDGLVLSLDELFSYEEFESADDARKAVAFLRRHADRIEKEFKDEN